MSTGDWRDVDPADLAPVVLVAGGFLTTPGWYRPMAAALRDRGAADVVVAADLPARLGPVRRPRPGSGHDARRPGAPARPATRSAASPASRGAPILLRRPQRRRDRRAPPDLARAVRGPPARRQRPDRRARHARGAAPRRRRGPLGEPRRRRRGRGSPTGTFRGRASPPRPGTWPSRRAASSATTRPRTGAPASCAASTRTSTPRPTSRSSPGTGSSRSPRRCCPGRATWSSTTPSTGRASRALVRRGRAAGRLVAGRAGGVARRPAGPAGRCGRGNGAGPAPVRARAPGPRRGRVAVSPALSRRRRRSPGPSASCVTTRSAASSPRVSQAARSVEPCGSSRRVPPMIADPVEERDRVHLPRPPVGEPPGEDPRADGGDALHPADEPGLLLELAHDGVLGALAEVDAAAGERPGARGRLAGRQAAAEEALAVAADRVGGDAHEADDAVARPRARRARSDQGVMARSIVGFRVVLSGDVRVSESGCRPSTCPRSRQSATWMSQIASASGAV